MTATFYVGDAIKVMGQLPEKSVDLVLTSPPFLALRSYLPADHPDKALEGGSQSTPGEFIDWLLDVVEACTRVLAPHGSLVFELGDTYSGSGESGWERDKGEYRRGNRSEASANGLLSNRTGGNKGNGWPQAKSLSLIPESFRWAMVYGRNPFTGRECATWRLRNVIRWVRPNPPVGALGDKFRPATSELMVFCKAKDRFFDLDAVREPFTGHGFTEGSERASPNEEETLRNWSNGLSQRVNTHSGAPPLDWWNIPPGGYVGAHYAVWPPELLIKPIKAMCPTFVCPNCGPVRLEYNDDALLRTMQRADNESVGVQGNSGQTSVLFSPMRRNGDAGGEAGSDPSERLSPEESATRLRRSALAGSSTGEQGGGSVRASIDHGGTPRQAIDGRRGSASQERDTSRQPGGESRGHAEGFPLSHPDSTLEAAGLPSLRSTSVGDKPCPRCGAAVRKGVVLDPFGGSGTTALVATGHGRDCILIDIDERNFDLALDRVGPLVLTLADREELEAI